MSRTTVWVFVLHLLGAMCAALAGVRAATGEWGQAVWLLLVTVALAWLAQRVRRGAPPR